jgi:mannose-1-phosphate guanylyltransferase
MLIPVILCGGVGSRLWPLSRDTHPKPFIKLPDGQTLLQKAFLRGSEQSQVSEIVTVTNRDLFFKIEDQYRQLNHNQLATSYILEPFGRNTAAAIASAALHIRKTYGDHAVMLVLAADHVIANTHAFAEAVQNAIKLANTGRLVTFGIKPLSPETGYGYIEADGTNVLRFVEKPDHETAMAYVESGRFFWNSGMFCFRAGDIIDAMRRYCPEVLSSVSSCIAESRYSTSKGFTEIELSADSFMNVPDISIDYAVMEKADNVSVVACDIGWDDIGSWNAISNMTIKDERANHVRGEVYLHDVDNCTIQSENRVIGAVGIKDLIIVDTPDALLVVNKNRAQEVKEIYNKLKSSDHKSHRTHVTEQRPWGSFTVLEESEGFKIKRLVVDVGGRLSLQLHHKRSEHWVVVSGVAKITNGEQELILNANQSTYIPVEQKHRLENYGDDELVIIEVQCGHYLGEDDIVRFQDIYERIK